MLWPLRWSFAKKKNVIDGRKQDSIKWEWMVLKGIYVNANIYPLIFTPPRNHGGVIFSLQFVCLSACEQNSNQTDALISTQLWLINLHFLTLPVLLGKFQAIDWRPVLGVVRPVFQMHINQRLAPTSWTLWFEKTNFAKWLLTTLAQTLLKLVA